MGGEGSMMAAMQSLKNNRALRSKRRKGKLSFVSSIDEKWVDPKKATFEQLMEIRKRVRRERKIRTRKIIALTIVGVLIIILLFFIIDWDALFNMSYI